MSKYPNIPNHIIRASAGTGKTFALSNRYIQLLAQGNRCDGILATTFTRKAAGEILDRIVQRLSTAALDVNAAQELGGFIKQDLDSVRCREILMDLMKQIHRLQIGTLDSFFNRLARSFSLELQLPLDWAISDNQLLDELSDQSVQEMLSSTRAIQMMHLLAKGEAQRGVAHLISRTVNDVYGIFLDSDALAWDQLSVPQMLPKDELQRRVEALESAPPNGKMQTDRLQKDIALANNDEWGEFACSRQLSCILADTKYGAKLRSSEMEKAYIDLAEHIRGWVANDLKRRNLATHGLVAEYAERFSKKQQEYGALRFDDVTHGLQSLVGMRDANNRLMFRLDQQIEHLLLDEFQDTSPGQWQVIEPFAKWVSAKNSGRSFFCVGDMKQAIYGWRGGVAEIFDLVDEQLDNLEPAPDLIKSYRSALPIIQTVNQVFLGLNKVKTDCEQTNAELIRAAERFKEHETSRTELGGHVTLQFGPDCAKELQRDPHKKRMSRNDLMLDQMVEQIAETYHARPNNSIGVLTRTNDTVADIIFLLQQAGIPASQEGGNYLTDSAAVETVLAAIQLADHPGDTVARFQVSHSVLGDTLGLLPESTQNRKANQKAVPAIAAELRDQLINRGYGPTVERLARILAPHCTARELTRLQRLVELSYEYNDSWTLRADQFVAHLRETKVPDESSARVRVMTVHGAKGLEFDVVFLPIPSVLNWYRPPQFVVDRKRPTDPASLVSLYVNRGLQSLLPQRFRDAFNNENRSKVRDELCILYVALTRAVHAMHIFVSFDCKPNAGKSFGRVLLNTLSPGKETRVASEVVFETGDPNWQSAPTPNAESNNDSPYYLPASAVLGNNSIASEPMSGRGTRFTSPSKIESQRSLNLNHILISQADRDRRHRGTLIHACFETVSWLDRDPVSDEVLSQSMKSADPLVNESDLKSTLQEFRRMITNQEILNWMSESTYQRGILHRLSLTSAIEPLELRVETERGFAVENGEELLDGFIDRIVWVYQEGKPIAAEIFDLKTDKINSTAAEERTESYRSQLEAYQTAIELMTGIDSSNINSFIVYVSSGRVVPLVGANRQSKKNPSQRGSSAIPDPKMAQNKQLKLW